MSAPNDTSSDLIEIRKYPNRRYYDRTRSRHLTLEDIRQLIRDGANVKIVDSQTGADITSKTLTQMIVDFDASKLELLTVPLLTEIIRVNDQVMKGFFEKFFHQALASFFAFQQHLERQLSAGAVLPSLFPLFTPWSASAKAEANGSGSAPVGAPAGVDGAELSRTIQELQKQVAALQRKSKKKATSRKRR